MQGIWNKKGVMMEEFVKLISSSLGIDKPKVKFLNLKGTRLAEYRSDSRTLVLNKSYEVPFDMYFAIAHELRHKYQIDNHTISFDDYNSDTSDIKAYNLQEAELDANAYACVVMRTCFGVTPLFNGLDEEVKAKIFERAK